MHYNDQDMIKTKRLIRAVGKIRHDKKTSISIFDQKTDLKLHTWELQHQYNI